MTFTHTPAPLCSRWYTPLCAALLVGAVACAGRQPTGVPPAPPPPPAPATSAFLDTVEQRTFNFFWATTNPVNGLVPDRYPTPSFSSIAATGFGLTAYPVGVERGWVTRSQASSRVLVTLRFLWKAPQGTATSGMTGYQGFYYHFLDMQSGARYRDVELSTIDTALLLGGVLFCQQYFDGPSADEVAIRAYADSIYRRVDWRWIQPRAPLVAMGWTPEEGFHSYDWRGYDEAMLLYILALGSPTHAITDSAWSAWASSYRWGTWYGQTHIGFAPLFGHQYSQLWIDFRGIQDAYTRAHGIDYFENSRRATYAQQAYARANPNGWTGYSDSLWGLSASDGPGDFTLTIGGRLRTFFGYAARGSDFTEVRDDGTIAPTAVGGSVPFAPDIAIPALESMRRSFGGALFSTYGFLDAFNLTLPANATPPAGRMVPGVGWVDVDYLGIDEGPLLAMIENYRSELVWRYMRRSPYIVSGLRRAGFTGGWLAPAARTSP
ncbi:MAG TPA: glucoamylase family protein [Gemmatimonadaceae bacterium]|jgi:hypothetical protein